MVPSNTASFGPGKPASVFWLGQAVIAWTVSASMMPVAWTFASPNKAKEDGFRRKLQIAT